MPLVTARCRSVTAMSNLYIVIIATLSTPGFGPLQSRLYDSTAFVEFGSRWNSVPHTLFPLQYGGNLKVHSTLFSPIIEGKKVQRVKVYPYPSLSGMTNGTYKILRNVYISVIHGQLPYCVKCLITYTYSKVYCSL